MTQTYTNRGGHNLRKFVVPQIGAKFSRLTVIGGSDRRDKGGKRYWLFRCDCGTEKEHLVGRVAAGAIRSCGCLQREKQHTAVVKYADPLQKYRNALSQQYRSHAQERGIPFELSSEQISELCHEPCRYCGRVNVSKASKHYKGMLPHNGIDRVDSSKGYTIDNVVTCCKTCNVMKQRMSVEEFFSHVRLIAAHCEENRG